LRNGGLIKSSYIVLNVSLSETKVQPKKHKKARNRMVDQIKFLQKLVIVNCSFEYNSFNFEANLGSVQG